MDTTTTTTDIMITGYRPGAIGRVAELHGTYYAENWDLGLYFEAKVASDLAAFMTRFDPAHDGAWFAVDGEQIVGAILIDGSNTLGEGARLRFFIVAPDYHGRGVGGRLMTEAMAFCKAKAFARVHLTTFGGLNAARHLYEKHGFKLISEKDGSHLTGNAALTEQVFELVLGA